MQSEWQRWGMGWGVVIILRQLADLAAASWELVVISMASCTDFCRESRVRWSTGSTDWMSMLVMTRLF